MKAPLTVNGVFRVFYLWRPPGRLFCSVLAYTSPDRDGGQGSAGTQPERRFRGRTRLRMESPSSAVVIGMPGCHTRPGTAPCAKSQGFGGSAPNLKNAFLPHPKPLHSTSAALSFVEIRSISALASESIQFALYCCMILVPPLGFRIHKSASRAMGQSRLPVRRRKSGPPYKRFPINLELAQHVP
jgi:hypothetical protein